MSTRRPRSNSKSLNSSLRLLNSSSLRLRPDHAWIRARKDLLRQVKAEVAGRLGPEPDDLRTYRERYERELRKAWKPSSKAELMREIERADIVYGGDFHALGQAQRTHLKILRALTAERPVIVAMECFSRASQKWLDLYLSGAITVDELKRRARWGQSWGFPWENFRPLLEIAKRRGFGLLALNEAPGSRAHADLALRERNSARVLREALVRQPGALIYVIYGDLHLATRHLPAEVRRQLRPGSRVRDLIIHLNSEAIYFQLARRGLELSVDVVRLSENRFCILSSPPWVQWQSYLLYLDQRPDDPNLDRGDDDEDFDPTDQVAALVRLIARDLGIEFKLSDLAVYAPEDNRIWQALERALKSKDRALARTQLASGRSFFLPSPGTGYLAVTTVNHAASLAGQYIHARLSGRQRPLWNLPGDFPALIWTEAVSYFISKLINHKRQSHTPSDLRAQVAFSGPADEHREALRLALDRMMSELILVRQGRWRAPQVRARRKASYLEAARILGGMMGERLYMAHRSRKLSAKDVVHLLSRDVTRRSFAKDYEDILRKLGESGHWAAGARPKRERL